MNSRIPAAPHQAMIWRAQGTCPPKAHEVKIISAPKCTSTARVSQVPPDPDEEWSELASLMGEMNVELVQ